MTVRHLMAIALIYVGCTIAWFALGSSVVIRTGEFNQQLGADVALLWGPPHAQRAPEASLARPRQITETVVETKAGRVMQTTAGVNWVEVFATPAPRPVKGNPC